MFSHASRAHLELAHAKWKEWVRPGDTVVDATCGNGHDTLFLAKLALKSDSGTLFALDLQGEAIEKARNLLSCELPEEIMERICFRQGCHTRFPPEIPHESVRLIVYNLGYLPGGNKSLTTLDHTTLESLENAQLLIAPGGAICVTCYPGHPAGQIEEKAVLEYASRLDPHKWGVCHHRWVNRKLAPSLLLLEKRKGT